MKIFLLIQTVLIAANLSAHILPIGDFSTLKDWSGLEKTEQKSPSGDYCASVRMGEEARFEYTKPQTYLGWDSPNFADMLDEIAVEDWFGYRYVEFDVKLPQGGNFEFEFTAYPLHIGRPDHMSKVSGRVIISDKGWNRVVFDLKEFEYKSHLATFWRYIDSVSFSGRYLDGSSDGEFLISQIRLKTAKRIAFSCEATSKPAKAGETAEYELKVSNLTAKEQNVLLRIDYTGWQAAEAKLSKELLILEPWAEKTVVLTVEVNDLIAPGGREAHKITAIPGSRADLKEQIEFITVRYMPHPYLLHNSEGWQDVIEKAQNYDWANLRKQEYIQEAKQWKKPAIRTGAFCYMLADARAMLRAAIGWKLSGDEDIERKVIGFLQDFSNPETGYISKLRSNNGSHVHEGMFFMAVARAYDLLYYSNLLTCDDHKNMEATFRRYVRWVDPAIRTGDGNNHQVSLSSGAVMCGLVLQDFSIVNRFLHGTGGYYDLMAAGILDDGHYFEGTANYQLVTANIAKSLVVALDNWGINAKDWHFEPKYGKFVMVSDWATRGDFLGMSFEKAGGNTRNWRSLKDMWDTLIMQSDYRGMAFATSNSIEIDLTSSTNEAGFGVEMAYYLYRDKKYIPLIVLLERRDLLYGVADLPNSDFELGRKSYYADNVGYGVLRSQTEGRQPREQIQAVQRYGTHGGYHGHFNRTGLSSLMRYGRSFFTPQAAWYGYGSFLFKMWVQTSNSHNMVVVDNKMQKPADNERLLFHSGEVMQVSATQIETVWIDPPYGGQTPYKMTFPQEKAWSENRWMPVPDVIRAQGDTGEPTLPVLQRRLLVLTDDYLVVADYIRGEDEHNFDNLLHCKGLETFDAVNKEFVLHTPQFSSDPYSSAQFITNCNWYDIKTPFKASFEMDFDNPDFLERVPTSLPGVLKLDYYCIYPDEATLMIGNFPDTQNVARRLYYKVYADGQIVAENKLGAWILGSSQIDVCLEGVNTLEIETRIENARDLKTIFLGDPFIETQSGEKIYLADMQFDTENIAPAAKPYSDYYGDKVTIFGQDYFKPLAAEPVNRNNPGRITINLDGKNAERFKAVIGGDYPTKSEKAQRKTIALRQRGKQAAFLTLIELYEKKKLIESVSAKDEKNIEVVLSDGRTQHIFIDGMESQEGRLSVEIKEYIDKKLVRYEKTK